MKSIIILLLIITIIPLVHAGTPTDPDVNLFLAGQNIVASGQTIRITASTSFDPPPISGVVCILGSNCRLQIEDCNGSIYACETNTENVPFNIIGDWNGIPGRANFENDVNCSNNCTRFGPVEDTPMSVNLTLRTRGSRWIRACWVDDSTPFRKCSPVQRIHAYDDIQCLPPRTGNFIVNRFCQFKHPDNNFTAIPSVIFVDKNLVVVQAGQLVLDGVSIDFNARSGITPLAHRFQISSSLNSFNNIFGTNLGYFDTNLPVFDRNQIRIFGYSNN